ncbi:hypothetical protein [Streptomyces sp. NPDC003015]
MRRGREENTIQDLPGSLWHADSSARTPEPVGRIGPLARPVALVSFAAATDIVRSGPARSGG